MTDTTTASTSHTEDKTLTDRAKDAASTAQEKVTAATSATIEKAKDRPYAAAGIAVGVAAAVAGAAYGATKLREGDGSPKTKKTKTTPKK